MTLEDARIILGNSNAYTLHPRASPYVFEQWEWSTITNLKLDIVRYWLATRTIQRHLPVPLYHHDAYHYIQVGYAKAKGMTFIPYKGGTQWNGSRRTHSVLPPPT
jgi:hypothetical protein